MTIQEIRALRLELEEKRRKLAGERLDLVYAIKAGRLTPDEKIEAIAKRDALEHRIANVGHAEDKIFGIRPTTINAEIHFANAQAALNF